MVSICPLISKFSSPFTNPFVNVSSAAITIGVTGTFHSFFFFSVLLRGLGTYPSFRFLSILLRSGWTAKSTIQQVFSLSPFFLLNITNSGWSSGRNLVICLYLKIPAKFVRLIFQDEFWVMRIPFCSMVRFQFLAQFPVDHLPHPVKSGLFALICCIRFIVIIILFSS